MLCSGACYWQMSNGGALRDALEYVNNTTARGNRSQILRSRLENLGHEPEQRLREIAQSSDKDFRDEDNRDAMVERLQKAIHTASTIEQGHEERVVAKCLAIAAKIELKDRRDASRAQQEQVPSLYLVRAHADLTHGHLFAGLRQAGVGSSSGHDRR